MKHRDWVYKPRIRAGGRFWKMMKSVFSGDRLRVDETVSSSESLATRDFSASGYSSRAGETETKADASNIEEVESSLRESSVLNYEEARALLGRLEFQKGNIEAALHVFEGIDIAAVTPKMKLAISIRSESNRRRSQSDAAPPMSLHAVSLLCEAIFLKAKSLQALRRFKEAAQSCKVILDTVDSASPEGLPIDFTSDCKLQETLNKAVEFLPELWKLAGDNHETILSYRRALLYHWNLDIGTTSKIEKEFAIFLLYSGCEASPPDLRFQTEWSFVPRNNLEEAVLLLLVLLRKLFQKRIAWDPSIIDHLAFALSVSGELKALASQIEELSPGIMEKRERYRFLALCYYGEGEDVIALNLLRNLFHNRDDPNCNHIMDLLLASKICGNSMDCVDEGIGYTHRVLPKLHGQCNHWVSVAYCILGVLLSAQSRLLASDSEQSLRQSEALEALETAWRTMIEWDPNIMYQIVLEYARQRKLDVALYHGKELLKLEAGATIRSYTILAQIFSAQKRFVEAEAIVNAALEEVGKWEQGKLLQIKAKLQISQRQFKDAIETYTQLLAILQLRKKNYGFGEKVIKNKVNHDRNLEMETWHDLANVYTSLSLWRDAEVCLSKSEAISHSASWWHATGLLHQAKGLHREALIYFEQALDVEPNHVPSLISVAAVLRRLSSQPSPVMRSLLSQALKLDRMNPSAWYNLGLLCKEEARPLEAADCFEAAYHLEESAPVEPFR